MYDLLRKLEYRISLVFYTLRLRLMFFKNIHFAGFENIHRTTQIYGRLKGKVMLGKHVSTYSRCCLVSVGGELIIGDYCSFSENSNVVSHEKIFIGNHCLFGPNVCIYDHDHLFRFEGIQNEYKTSPIIIEDNCWVGANAVILRGTHIGEGYVIGAGTVFKGTIPAHSIVRSNRTLEIESIKK